MPSLIVGMQGLWAVSVLLGGFSSSSIASYRLKAADTERYNEAIEDALNSKDYQEAEELVELAETSGHMLAPDLVKRTQVSMFQRAVVAGEKVGRGAILGTSDSAEEIAGMVAADLFVVGDIRDLAIEAGNWVSGREVDRFTLGLAAVGALTSGAAIVSGGISGLPDMGLSLTKAAHKARRLSAGLTKSIGEIAGKVIDGDAFAILIKRLNLQKLPDMDEVRAGLSRAIRHDEAAKLTAFAGDVGSVAKSAGPRAGMAALEVADNPREMRKIATLSRTVGKKTGTVLRFIGRSLFSLVDIMMSLVMALMPLVVTVVFATAFLLRRIMRLAL